MRTNCNAEKPCQSKSKGQRWWHQENDKRTNADAASRNNNKNDHETSLPRMTAPWMTNWINQWGTQVGQTTMNPCHTQWQHKATMAHWHQKSYPLTQECKMPRQSKKPPKAWHLEFTLYFNNLSFGCSAINVTNAEPETTTPRKWCKNHCNCN